MPPMSVRRMILALSFAILLMAQSNFAQQNQPLTNDDVLKMVKSGLPEPTIINAIHANDTRFDVSANGLIALQKTGITQPVMDAMIAASAKKRDASVNASVPPTNPSSTGPTVGQLSVMLIQDGKQQTLPIEKTQLAQTKTKASSLGGLSSDAALNQVFQVGVNQVAWEAWQHGGGGAGYMGVSGAGTVMAGMMDRHKATVTYVWALPGPASATVISNSPNLDVTYSGIPGVNADQYEPAIVKLVPTSNNWRLIGASRGKTNELQSPTSDWDVYSTFVEEKVATQMKQIEPGHVQVTPASPLAAGQYGIVLRPRLKSKKFAGADVAKDQGEGLMLDSVWSFAVK